MKQAEEIRSYIEKEILPYLEEEENTRLSILKILRKNKWIGFFTGFAFSLIAGILFFPAAILGPFIGLLTYLIKTGNRANNFRTQFRINLKNNVISKMIAFLDSELTYSWKDHVHLREFLQSGLYPELNFNNIYYTGDDHVKGMIDKTYVEFSEITARSGPPKKAENNLQNYFHGFFFLADFNKNFSGRTFIFPDFPEEKYGSFIAENFQSFINSQKTYGVKENQIRLEDPEFEKLFSVFSSDETEARYILSPSFMEKLTTFRKQTGIPLRISFVNSKIFIVIPVASELFEMDPFKPVNNLNLLHNFADDFIFAMGITDELNLNTRIWSKL
ncbi:MAG: DUF3137 domain-containing protein [Spirochaetia bacterium]|nr:DUF3137 domain-containing protein [Spirochaetia bacterium]